jgi:hypothetical protein
MEQRDCLACGISIYVDEDDFPKFCWFCGNFEILKKEAHSNEEL